jgi:hypothetical protein
LRFWVPVPGACDTCQVLARSVQRQSGNLNVGAAIGGALLAKAGLEEP